MGLAIFISIIFIVVFCVLQSRLALRTAPLKKAGVPSKIQKKADLSVAEPAVPYGAFVLLFAVSLILRLVLAYQTQGYPSDMSCWSAWGDRMASLGSSRFYGFGEAEAYFCDYPPGYIYILGFLGWLAELMGIQGQGLILLYKLPGILCEMALIYVVVRLAEKEIGQKSALLLGILTSITPVFLLDTAIWGQIESVLALLLVLSLLQLYQKKYYSAALLFVAAALVKPQALLVAPVYLFAYLETKDWKMIGKTILLCLPLLLLCIIPFSPAWGESGSFFVKLLHSFNPLWLIQKYMDTLSSYAYFTVNAFNLYGLFGMNWAPLGDYPSALINVLNWGIIGLAVLLSGVLYFKIKNPGARLFLPAFFLVAFLFTFGFKMHERYMVPVLFFLLAAYILSKDKKLLWIFAGFSVTNFVNLAYVLWLVIIKGNEAPAYGIVGVISLLEVVLFLASAGWICYAYAGKGEKKPSASAAGTSLRELHARFWKWSGANPDGIEKQDKLVRADYLALVIIVLVYSCAAFSNLGDTHAPQTYYQPASTSDSFIIQFDSPQTVSKVTSYIGIGDVGGDVGLTLEASVDGNTWQPIEATATLKSVFLWNVEEITPTEALYIRGRPDSTDYMLFEIAFWKEDGSQIAIQEVRGNNPDADYTAMADEQQYAAAFSTYENSTYFDEIYHPRTAYEHLHLMPYYETTHPPLGKLIMSVGIAVFGMTPFGWRAAGTLFGVFMLPILYLFLKKLFGRTRYSVIGTLLFAFDFMHFSLTRMGTIDSYPVFFILCMYYFMYVFGTRALSIARSDEPAAQLKNKTYKRKLYGALALSGISWGLGAASKWIAVYAGVGLAVEFVIFMALVYRALPAQKRKGLYTRFAAKICSWCVLFFILIPGGIYLASYIPIVLTGEYGNLFQAMWNNQKYMLNYHSTLTATHPYSSKWYQWPIDYRPLWAYSEPAASRAPGKIGCISIFGNPLLWWGGIAAFVYSVVVGIKKRSHLVLFLGIALAAQYVPWMFVTRAVFIYHFFASTPFLVCFVIYAMRDLEGRYRWFAHISHAYLAVCLLLFVAFYPVLTGVEVSKFYVETFLRWFDSWVFWN